MTEIKAVEVIQAALDAGPTDGPWRAEELEACDGSFFPSFTTIPHGRFHHDPQVDADYIAACNPENIREVLQTLASKEAEIARLRIDAERYQWLRSQHWNDNTLCVVARPKEAVKLGMSCPSGTLLDDAIAIRRAALTTQPAE